MNIQGFEVPDSVVLEMRARGESPVVCAGCGQKLLATRNIRQEAYCASCEGKKSMLRKYSNGHYHATALERAQIMSGLSRAGRG